jgi:hypothetical protein
MRVTKYAVGRVLAAGAIAASLIGVATTAEARDGKGHRHHHHWKHHHHHDHPRFVRAPVYYAEPVYVAPVYAAPVYAPVYGPPAGINFNLTVPLR